MYIDSHAHLTKEELMGQLDGILERAQQAKVLGIVNICTNLPTLERGLQLGAKYPWIYNAGATTPHDAEKEGEALFPIFEKHARSGDLVAVGETGLDYYYFKETKVAQQRLLARYLQLALECRLPVVIHCRDAFADFFSILDAEYQVNGHHAPGVLHCFTGTMAEAEEVLKRGWYLSLSAIITFKKSEQLREVAKMVPLNQLLIETDTPYLAPQSHRGKTNEPSFLPETAQLIAEVKNVPVEEIALATAQNAKALFRLHN